MYLFAHLFTGVLIGSGFSHICNERWVVPVCIAGALFSDLLDKPLTLLMPGFFGSTRTIGHTLLLTSLVVPAAFILWHQNRSFIGIAFAGTVLVHQLLDMMWIQPVTWFFPLCGTFPLLPASGGVLQFLWLELMNPSEWVFALASFTFMLGGYVTIPAGWPFPPVGRTTGPLQYGMAGLLGFTGACLVIAGLNPFVGIVPALLPGPDKTLMAGLVAVCGALVLIIGLKRPVVRL